MAYQPIGADTVTGALPAKVEARLVVAKDARINDLGATAALMANLDAEAVSCGIQILGDSTGNDLPEWPNLLADWIGANYPGVTTRIRTWDDATQTYGAPRTVTTGYLGDRHAQLLAGRNVWLYQAHTAGNSLTGDLDVAFNVALDDWTPSAAQAFGGKFGGSGFRGWMLRVTTGGNLELTYSTDGNGSSAATSSVAVPYADGARGWVRFTYKADNGMAGRDIKFWTSTDGKTWTQLGSTVTHALASTVFSPVYDLEVGSRANGSDFLKGKVYEIRVRNGIDGPLVAPANPESWVQRTNNATWIVWGGAPVVEIINGSRGGANIDYLMDATRHPKMTPDYGTLLTFISCSHNDSTRLGPPYLANWDTLLSLTKARLPMTSVVVVGQNPRGTAADVIAQHAGRRAQLAAWAQRNGCRFLDVFGAFNNHVADNGVALNSLLDQAGIHPTDAAQADIWWPTVRDMLLRRS